MSNQNRGFNPQQPSFTTTTGGKNPKQLHIAHRRSPSELTNLMMEQIALQRQLEIVQAQQQQILSQQGGHSSQLSASYSAAAASGPSLSGNTLQPPATYHTRTGSNTHKRSQSSVTGVMGSFSLQNNLAPPPKFGSVGQGSSPQALGHSRRHSLGLNEAKRAAAQVQAQRAGKEAPQEDEPSTSSSNMPPPSGFKFPSTIVDPPRSSPQQPQSSSSQSSTPRGHGRSRSMVPQSPQRGFQFPPKSPSSSQQFDSLAPPQPQQQQQGYHDRRQSGHFRTNSRNFDMNQNWRQRSPQRGSQAENELLAPPTPQFTPGHRSRGSHGGNSISSMAGFQMQGGQNANGRKSLFAPYLPQSSIPELVADGRLVVGTLRVNKKNRSDAYVATDGLLDADIFICGSKDRNRALEGDLVAVELLSVDEVWSSKREKEEKKRRKDNSNSSNTNSNSSAGSSSHTSNSNVSSRGNGEIIDDVHNDASTHSAGSGLDSSSNANSSLGNDDCNKSSGSLQRRGSLKQRPTLKKNDDVEVEGQSLLLVEEEEISDEYKPLYAGQVVAVIDRIPGQLFAGTLGLLRPSQHAKEQQQPTQRPKIVWFKPTDKKVPLIAIPTEQAPKDFVENVDKYNNKLFVASIKRWPITSLHPFGTLISELGPLNDPKIEVDAILRDNNFLCEEYIDESGSEREKFELSPVDMEAEFAKRRDFSGEYVLAVSETGATSDHAVHVKRLSDDKIELGVHISDVAAFVKEGSLLDKNARKRSSSVFLAQKTVHLFPQAINQLLSFNKSEKKLSMSVVFEIDTAKFEVDNVWIGETYVQPKNLLTYDQIDAILTESVTSPVSTIAISANISDTSSAAKDYVKTIALISREFRRQRLENSKLSNEITLTLLDQVDDEKVRLDLNLFKSSLSASVFNELFLKVNGTVAQRTYAVLGDSAFLRRQTMPTLQRLETFKRKSNSVGVDIDTSSPASLINSIMSIEDVTKRQCIEILFHKALTRSKYFVAGKVDPENFGAFYFNLPLYTHFTAPLRRYADSIVHRQLKSALLKSSDDGLSIDFGGAAMATGTSSSTTTVASIAGSSSSTTSSENGDVVSATSTSNNTVDELESLKMTAEYCNFKKDCAKAAQDQSVHLLLSQTINEMSRSTGQLIVMGIVLQVYESAFDVYLPEFGIEKRVHGDQLPLRKAEFDRKKMVLELYWEKGLDTATFIPEDEREPLSYRNSIKNKFKTSANDIAQVLQKGSSEIVSSKLADEFAGLNLAAPSLSLPQMSSSSTGKSPLDEYLKGLKLRVEGEDYIQEICELESVPILLRAEIGMALPCLTVHALNPFTNLE